MIDAALSLIEHYATLNFAHVLLAPSSVGLFASRSFRVLMQARWPMRAGVRRLSVLIDTALLAAGCTLWWLLSLRPDRDDWLAFKPGLIVLYIGFGSLALKRAQHRTGRAVAFVAALVCIVMVAVVARAHDALAPWRLLRALGIWLGAG